MEKLYRVWLQGVDKDDCKDYVHNFDENTLSDYAETFVEERYDDMGEYPPHKSIVVFQPIDDKDEDIPDEKRIFVKVRTNIEVTYTADW